MSTEGEPVRQKTSYYFTQNVIAMSLGGKMETRSRNFIGLIVYSHGGTLGNFTNSTVSQNPPRLSAHSDLPNTPVTKLIEKHISIDYRRIY